MLVPRRTLKERHPAIAQCARGGEQKRRRLAETELRESTERAFKAYGRPLYTFTSFKYLGQALKEADKNWPLVVGYPRKA